MIGNECSSEDGDGLTDYDTELDHIGLYSCEEDETDRIETTVAAEGARGSVLRRPSCRNA